MHHWQDSTVSATATTLTNEWFAFDSATSTVAFYDPWPTPLPEPPHPRERTIFEWGRPALSGARPRCRDRVAPPHVRAYAPRPVRAQHRG